MIMKYFSKEYMYIFSKMIIDSMMIFLPSISYVAQAIKFKETKSSKGFSKYMCFILLYANILRIFFWMGKQFTIVLLYQSLVVIASQFYLIYACLKYASQLSLPITNEKEEVTQLKKNKMTIINNLFNVKLFWMWDRMIEYYLCTAFFVLIMMSVSNLFGYSNMHYINVIGAISAFSESVIAMPQIKINYETKDVSNLSALMILCWLFGDSFKTIYYIYSLSPIQLIACGFLQVSLDITLSLQLYYYGYYHNSTHNSLAMKPIEETMKFLPGENDTTNNVEEEDDNDEDINIKIEVKTNK